MSEQAKFVVIFVPLRGVNGTRALRLLLKSAGRTFGLVAVDAREEHPAADNVTTTSPSAEAQRSNRSLAPGE
jgi:hypothetical protein